MVKMLVAGFDAFGNLSTNPSGELATELARTVPDAKSIILPTSYERAATILLDELRQTGPSYGVMFGYSRRAESLRLERYARNRDKAKRPDNDGRIRSSVIDSEAPEVLSGRVDVAKLHSILTERGCNVSMSENAGGYVCNHTYFKVLAYLHRSGKKLPFLFAHIPGPELSRQTVETGRALLKVLDQAV